MALCKICGETNNNLFYSSIKTYCKEHWKDKVRKNRLEKIDHYRAFDRMRASQPHRVAGCLKTVAAYRKQFPNRAKANADVEKAVRSGKLRKLPCFFCGVENSVGHHPNYDAPLDVIWLCQAHHKEAHKILYEIDRCENQPV